jgi:hypothetical protein
VANSRKERGFGFERGGGQGGIYRECTPRPKKYSVSVSARAIFVSTGFFMKTADHFKENSKFRILHVLHDFCERIKHIFVIFRLSVYISHHFT